LCFPGKSFGPGAMCFLRGKVRVFAGLCAFLRVGRTFETERRRRRRLIPKKIQIQFFFFKREIDPGNLPGKKTNGFGREFQDKENTVFGTVNPPPLNFLGGIHIFIPPAQKNLTTATQRPKSNKM